MYEKIKTFKDLVVWQKSIELVKNVYRITKDFPIEEQYCITAQMRRASISIPSNIAEGFRRKHNKEYMRFLNIALGSCAELETQIIIARELSYIDVNEERSLLELLDYICRMIVNLNKKLI